ncbi:MAG: DUF1015 domain-containing protein [Treponema sp.]|jgi:hypothetical protein|nr:DUF1015 domain-containing protein [Treponema sp.]
MSYQQKFKSLGIEIPSILLPKSSPEFNMEKWPVIACDQFTQDRGFWRKVKDIVCASPSTFNMIFPEIFLADDDAAGRITDIHSNMKRYLKDGIFSPLGHGFIYLERDTPYQKKRRGLIAAIDLEHYDWHPDARPLIRSTEGTVRERLPARCSIRRGAPLELPHILLLIDDDKDILLPALGEMAKRNTPVYNTPLMMDCGNVSGWFLDTENDFSFIADKLDELCRRSSERYEGQPFLFAAGDGNHSLAAAKEIWNEIKEGIGDQVTEITHPCRYALVEIENIYDRAIQFEPIHRLVFDIGYEGIVSLLSKLPGFSLRNVNSEQELSASVSSGLLRDKPPESAVQYGNRFGVISEGRYALIETSASGIATACLQPLLDEYAKDNPQLIDYIHDEKELFRLSAGKEHTANLKVSGILLPPVQKSGLFETVARLGPLPRKSFSMGHSCEKRFYLECRSLI